MLPRPALLIALCLSACALPEAAKIQGSGGGGDAGGGAGGSGGGGGMGGAGGSCLAGSSGDVIDLVSLPGEVVHALAVHGPYVYFGTDEALMRVRKDGCSAPEPVHAKAGRARHVAVDDAGVYYTVGGPDFDAGPGWVVIVPTSGAAVELPSGPTPVSPVAVDDAFVYAGLLGPSGVGGVVRAPKDGSQPLSLFLPGSTDGAGVAMAIDVSNVYFLDGDWIGKSGKSIPAPTELVNTGPGPREIVADGAAIYWIDYTLSTVRAFPLPSGPDTYLGSPGGRSVTAHGDWVYWVRDDSLFGTIWRAHKDGAGQPESVVTDQECSDFALDPFGCRVAVDDDGLFWTVPPLGLVRFQIP